MTPAGAAIKTKLDQHLQKATETTNKNTKTDTDVVAAAAAAENKILIDTLEQENNLLKLKNELLLDMMAEIASEAKLSRTK